MNVWHNYPFVRIVVPFIIGIFFSIGCDVFIPIWIFIVLLFIGFSLTYIAKFRTYKLRNLYGLFLFLLFFIGGNDLASVKLIKPAFPSQQLTKAITVYIVEPPEETEKCTKLVVRTVNVYASDSCYRLKTKALLYLQKDSLSKSLLLGDEILILSAFDTLSPPMNPHAFNYKRYLKFKQILYQSYIRSDQWSLISRGRGNKLKLWANGFRTYLLETLQKYEFEAEHLGVASAILLGYDQILDPETRDEFSDAGAMHVLCVSGLHVGIIYLIFASLLSFLKKYKKGDLIKGMLLLLVIWLYAFITGLSPSVMRASTMLSFIIIGEGIHRKASVYNSLAASAFLLLLIDPLMLMEVGFQLSYSAVLGIVSIYPILRRRLYVKSKIAQKIRDILIVSLAAQLGTFPLAIYYFHQFPLYFLLTNLVVVSFAGILIYVGFSFFALSAVPYLNSFLAYVLKKCVDFLCYYVAFVESLPSASLEKLVLSIPSVIMLSLLIVAVFRAILLKSKQWFFVASILVFLLLGLFTLRNYKIENTHAILFYNAGNGIAMDFISSGKNMLLVDSVLQLDEKRIGFIAGNQWIYAGVNEPSIEMINNELVQSMDLFKYKSVIRFRGETIMLFDGKVSNLFLSKNPSIDYVFITSNSKLSMNEIDSLYHPKQIIINANNSFYLQKKWKAEASEYNIPIWFIREEGACMKAID